MVRFSWSHRLIAVCLSIPLFSCGTSLLNTPAQLNRERVSACISHLLSPNSPDYLLLFAIGQSSLEQVKSSLSAGADIHFSYTNNLTPLHLAAYTGNTEVINHLLSVGARVDTTDCYGNTALHYASVNFHPEAVRVLLNAKASIQAVNATQDSALHFAVAIPPKLYDALQQSQNQSVLTQYFPLAANISLVKRSLSNLTDSKKQVIAQLLRAGAKLEASNKKRQTPLFYAAQAKDPQTIEQLIVAGSNIHIRDSEDTTILHELAKGPLPIKALLNSNRSSARDELTAKDYLGDQEEYPPLLQLIETLIDKGLDPNLTDKDGMSALHWAARTGQYPFIEALIQNGTHLNRPSALGFQEIHFAAMAESKEVLNILLKKGADINAVSSLIQGADSPLSLPFLGDKSQETPLSLAVRTGNENIIDFLITQGAKIEYRGVSSLIAAMYTWPLNRTEIILKLLAQGANVDFQDNKGQNALELALKDQNEATFLLLLSHRKGSEPIPYYIFPKAVMLNKISILENLLGMGAQVNAQDQSGNTALHYAFMTTQSEIAAWLQQKGANLNILNNNGESPFAATRVENYSNNAILPMLSNIPLSSWQQTNQLGNSLLMEWISSNRTDLSEYAVHKGSEVNKQNASGRSALHLAAIQGNLHLVKLLLEKGADPELVDMHGLKSIHLAIMHGKKDVLLHLWPLKSKQLDDQDYQSFMTAVELGHASVVPFLLSQGLDPSVYNRYGQTVAHIATRNANLTILKALKNYQVWQIPDLKNGYLPVHYAVSQKNSEVLTYLLDMGIDINSSSDKQKITPLHLAVMNSNLDFTNYLLTLRADPNQANIMGELPIHLAVAQNNRQIVNILLVYSDNLNALDGSGSGVLFHAASNNNKEMVDWLLTKLPKEIASRDITRILALKSKNGLISTEVKSSIDRYMSKEAH